MFKPQARSQPETNFRKLLLKAVREDDGQRIAELTLAGLEVDFIHVATNRSPLGNALKGKRFNAARALLEAGAHPLYPWDFTHAHPDDPLSSPQGTFYQSTTPLEVALDNRLWDWSLVLLEKGLPLNWRPKDAQSFLRKAVVRGAPDEVLDRLLGRLRDVNVVALPASELLEIGLVGGSSLEVVRRLIDRCETLAPSRRGEEHTPLRMQADTKALAKALNGVLTSKDPDSLPDRLTVVAHSPSGGGLTHQGRGVARAMTVGAAESEKQGLMLDPALLEGWARGAAFLGWAVPLETVLGLMKTGSASQRRVLVQTMLFDSFAPCATWNALKKSWGSAGLESVVKDVLRSSDGWGRLAERYRRSPSGELLPEIQAVGLMERFHAHGVEVPTAQWWADVLVNHFPQWSVLGESHPERFLDALEGLGVDLDATSAGQSTLDLLKARNASALASSCLARRLGRQWETEQPSRRGPRL